MDVDLVLLKGNNTEKKPETEPSQETNQKIKKDNVDFSLIFRMSENGTKAEDFHKYCDNKGPSLVIIKLRYLSCWLVSVELERLKQKQIEYLEDLHLLIGLKKEN